MLWQQFSRSFCRTHQWIPYIHTNFTIKKKGTVSQPCPGARFCFKSFTLSCHRFLRLFSCRHWLNLRTGPLGSEEQGTSTGQITMGILRVSGLCVLGSRVDTVILDVTTWMQILNLDPFLCYIVCQWAPSLFQSAVNVGWSPSSTALVRISRSAMLCLEIRLATGYILTGQVWL